MPRSAFAPSIVVLLAWVFAPTRVWSSDWKPIDPAHLALQQPKVDPSADAEALLWEVRVADEVDGSGSPSTVFEHYIRVKIFTERGREALATVDIPYASGIEVGEVAARTIRRDGSIVELKNSDIYRRTILKANDLKVKVTSFAVPAIERGVMVEYRWREVHRDRLATNLRLRFSREIPVHDVRYFVRPIAVPGYSMIAWPFNARFKPPEKRRDGFTMLALSDVPADVVEEYGLPDFEQRPNEHAAAGELPWQYEKQRAQIADSREVVYAETPLSPPTYSLKKRTGTFRLLDDGTLEGEARIEYTGHWAETFREQEDQDDASEREASLRNLITRRLPGAELNDVRVENVTELTVPYANAYRIRIPGYAQRTGTRLVIQPAVFQKGLQPTFVRADRKTNVYFPFPWTEEDIVTIEAPEGYTVEAPPAEPSNRRKPGHV